MVDSFSGRLKIQPIRIIPFDLGASLDDKCRAALLKYISNCKHLYTSKQLTKEKTLVGEETIQFCLNISSSQKLVFDCFSDGYGTITFFDDIFQIDLKKFDPYSFLLERRRIHRELLGFQHNISPAIEDHVEKLREAVYKQAKEHRTSATPTWRYKGLAYVFSFHLIEYLDSNSTDQEITITLVKENKEFFQKLFLILEPSFTGLEDTPMITNDDVAVFQRMLNRSPLVEEAATDYQVKNFEIRKGYIAFASWANLVILGHITPDIINDYVFLEKRIQHIWMLSFCLNDILGSYIEAERSLNLHKIESLRVKTRVQIQNFRHTVDASLGARYIKIIEALIETSMLNEQISRVELNLELICDRLNFLMADAQKDSQKRIEILLFLFAFIQAIGVVISISPSTVMPFSLSISLIFFLSGLFFLFRRK